MADRFPTGMIPLLTSTLFLLTFSLLLSGLDYAKQAVLFIGDASSEVQVVIDEEESPQAIDCQYPSGFGEMPEKPSRVQVISVDPPIAEVANKERPAKRSEILRGQCQTPGRIQRAI